MVFPRINISWRKIAKVFLGAITLVTFSALLVSVYFFGMWQGYKLAQTDAQGIASILEQISSTAPLSNELTPFPTSSPQAMTPQLTPATVVWGGPELWEAVNRRRIEFGVNPLNQRDELCTIASIRLNELLELGKLDGHEGFTSLEERRPDLEWIFEKYSTIAEFLAQGGETPQETVSLWENTLGHKKLMTGGEYVWGCIYAQETFAVAITTF